MSKKSRAKIDLDFLRPSPCTDKKWKSPIAGQSHIINCFDATPKTKIYTSIFAMPDWCIMAVSHFELLLLVQNSTYVAQMLRGLT